MNKVSVPGSGVARVIGILVVLSALLWGCDLNGPLDLLSGGSSGSAADSVDGTDADSVDDLTAGGGSDPGGSTESGGMVSLSLSDSPVDAEEVTGVFITITEVQFLRDGVVLDSFTFENPEPVNLLELTDGKTAFLTSLEIPSGINTQLRFLLSAPDKEDGPPDNPGCYISFQDGSVKPLFVPGGGESGYKAVGRFAVPVNGEVNLVADFDVRKSVIKTGREWTPGKVHYILRPTIRLVVEDDAGRISGALEGYEAYEDIIVYVYDSAAPYTPEEADDPEGDAPRFPNAVASTHLCDSGGFMIPFLAADTYTLVIAAYDGENFQEVLATIAGVVVEADRVTSLGRMELSSL